ncbi:MAG: hypothetical protein HRU18_00710 [Pseudoalteromonas sp.]|uniref:hypothetical protein n=1 Tax=Pseudoalteromonas sp. TaxID=53249 RepID=UPI001D61506D|nr:hypothetical protein [Pseudoalteromonas sp.]NRA76700.1 hypothetical protein [Pseudoalteromonas sp.]
MPQISVVGIGGDYTTLAAWVTAEGGIDYGVGNPAIAEITGDISGAAISGTFVRGYIVRAKAGEELNKETLSGAGFTSLVRPISTTAIACIIKDLSLMGGLEYTSGSALNELTDCLVERPGNNAVDANSSSITATGVITRNCARAFEATAANPNVTATNCTSLGVTGGFSFVRWVFTNCFHVGGGSGFAATLAGSDFNASDDTTSPGANSLDNRTTADMVDFAGGDFRTASASALATAGSGGTFIGFALESGGGGISVTGLLNSNYMVEYNMKKNIAGQSIGAQMITISDGSNFTGTVAAEVTIDNGTKTAGGGSVTHEGEGYHSYAPTQAETNGDHIAISFAGTGALSQTVQVYTTFPQSVDNNTAIAALNDFNPASDTVANVTLVATTTANTDMRGTNSALLAASYTAPDNAGITQIQVDVANVPTVTEFNARTLPSADYSQFDFAVNEVSANVTKINGVTIIGAGTSGDLWRA